MIIEEKDNKIIKIGLLFYICSIFGYIYETILTLIMDGKFLGHGILHGPWLPIYGTGAALIFFLNKFRKNKLLIFILSAIISGLLEWFCGFLILKYLGKRLWDYTGWFLNIGGHVCFLSVFIFGIGGLIIIYYLLPLINKILKKFKKRKIIMILTLLTIAFSIDILYSIFK